MPSDTPVGQTDSRLSGLCRQAIRLLDKALELPPQRMHQEVDEVENIVVELRNHLISRFRGEQHDHTSRWRSSLEKSNQIISLIAAVEYPATGFHRTYMEDARKVLREIEDSLVEGQAAR